MATNQGLNVQLSGDAAEFIASMKRAEAQINSLSSSATQAARGFGVFARSFDDTTKAENAFIAAAKKGNLTIVDQATVLNAAAAAVKQAANQTGSLNAPTQQAARNLGILNRSFSDVVKAERDFIASAKAGNLALVSQAEAANRAENAVKNVPKALNNLGSSSAKTGQIVTNFGRILSDLPYGFIAIQNNIDPLIQSLGLASGIGLAFTIAGSAATILIQKYGSLGNAFRELIGNITDAERAQARYNEIAKDAGTAQGTALATLELYRSALQDLNQPESERLKVAKAYNDVADKANKISKDQINDLYSINRLIDQQITLLGQRALVTAAESKLGEEAAKLLEVQIRTKPILDRVTRATAEQADAAAEATKNIKGLRLATPAQALADTGFVKSVKRQFDELAKIRSTQEYIDAQKELAAATKEFQKQLGEIAGVIDISGLTNSDTKETEKKVKTVADVLKELGLELKNIDYQAQLTGIGLDNVSGQKIGALQQAFQELVKLGLEPASPVLKDVANQINTLSAAVIGSDTISGKQLQKIGDAFKVPKQDASLTNVDNFQAQLNQRITSLKESVQKNIDSSVIKWGNITSGIGAATVNLGDSLRGLASSAAASLGEVIGSIASGGASLAQSLGKLIGVMGQFIIDFGKSLIEAATLRIIAEKTLFANPYVALAAGIAAVAVGTVLKNSVPSFATGGVVTGDQLIRAGDNPGRQEYIIPSEVMDKLGGGRRSVRVEGVLRGADIYYANERARRVKSRI